ncbi:MAG TPA: MmgE/PrpD family protein, partial [Gammaproteobacteria bacterium]|nr:MmgE/PrpD family protein [Gammaproteobacteria bacterium]
ARFASTLAWTDLPEKLRVHLRLLALDAIGCCLFGANLPWTLKLRHQIVAQGGRPESAIIGTGLRVPAPAAALVNATAGHGFEMDDIHRDAIIHGGSLVFPAALALAEAEGGIGGSEFLCAVAAGYEVGLRVGSAAGQGLLLAGFHPQGTSGAFASAAAAARVLRLEPAATRHALGIAGSLGAGLMAAQEGAMVKRLHAGHAARAGVEAALLARSGFSGIENVIEAGYGGFLSSHSPSPQTERLLSGLGERFELLEVGIKPFATVTSIHTCLEGLAAIMADHGLGVGDIERIRAGVSRATHVHCAWPYRGQSVTAAQMNLYFGLAIMAVYGDAGAPQFTEDRVNDPEILEFIARIEARIDDEVDAAGPGGRHAARIEVETRSGDLFERFVKDRLGSPEKPLSEERIRDKFRANAGAIMNAADVNELEVRLGQIESIEDVSIISDLCRDQCVSQ